MRGALAAVREVLDEMGVALAVALTAEEKAMNTQGRSGARVAVNGRDYRWPASPTVVICLNKEGFRSNGSYAAQQVSKRFNRHLQLERYRT